MNQSITQERLREAIRVIGSGWLADVPENLQVQMLEDFCRGLNEFVEQYSLRFKETPDPFALRDPLKGRAFFDFDTLRASTNIKILIWRILLGYEIGRVHLDYDSESETKLTFWLQTPEGDEEYSGVPFQDFPVLRHFGILTANGRFLLQGFYAFQ